MNGKQWLATGLTAAMTLGSLNLSAVAAETGGTSARAAASRPNIVFVLMDDNGYGELGCYGNTFNETPNIDNMAKEGALFTDFYTQPVCSPSRGCLMTGNNPLRNGVTNFLNNVNSYLDPNEFETMPQMLNRAGYHTGIIGKWHLNAGNRYSTSPGTVEKNGWDEVYMSERKAIGNGDYYYPYTHIPQVTSGREQNKYLVDDMNEEAVAYIKRNANKEEPFMLYLSHYATHTILEAPAETVEYFQQKRGTRGSNTSKDRNPYMAAMLKHIDDGIGMIDDTLEELGIKDNTILVLAGDNGGETQVTVNGILRGGKRQLYEGGIRNPMIFRWPETVEPGQRISCMTSMIDFYQTFGEIAGLDSIQENTGVSLLPLLDGSADTLDRDTLYWTYPRDTDFTPGYVLNNQTELVEGGAIRKGNYKYLQSFAFDDRRELYDLSNDPSETTNIIDAHPDVYHELARAMHEHLAADTVGKTFTATFDSTENYRWNAVGNFTRNDVCTASGNAQKILTTEDYLYYDADISASVQTEAGGKAGVIFRSNLARPANPAFHAYAAVLNVKNNAVELLKVNGSKSTVLASAPYALSANKAYALKVSTDSDEIKISVDDEPVLTHYDQSYINGSIGLFSDLSSATFDNLIVTGTQRTRPFTDQQLNFEPEGDVKIKADDHWVWFDEQPVVSGSETLVQADRLLDTMGLAYAYDAESKTFTASRGKNTLSCTAGNATATLNGEEVSLSAAPVEQNGHLLIPLSLLQNTLFLQVTTEDDAIVINSSLTESYKHNNPKIVYSPASAWTEVASIKRSTRANASASLTFTGTGVELYLDRGLQAGKFDVYLDDELVGDDLNAYISPATSHSLVFKLYGLPEAEHTIRVVNAGKKGASGGGTNININEFCVIKSEWSDAQESDLQSTYILNTDPQISYTSGWKVNENPAAFGGSTTRSSAAGESCTLKFSGTGVRLYLGKGLGAGILELFLDEKSEGEIDSYASVGAQQALAFEKLGLSAGEHTIRVVNTGKKNEASTSTNVNIDAFEVLSPSPVTDAQILSFTVPNQIGETVIDQQNHTISLSLPVGDLTKITPTVKVTSGATVAPASGAAVDLSKPVNYSVLSSRGLRVVYRVTATLTAPSIASVSIPQTVNLNKGAKYRYTYTLSPTGANATTAEWQSSNSKVATVTPQGEVTALSNGTTTITLRVTDATGATATASSTLRVSTPVQKIQTTGSITVTAGKSKAITATVTPADASDKTLTIRTADAKIAKVSGGKVYGVRAGTTKLYLSAGGVTSEVKVTVKSKVTKLTFKKARITVKGKKTVNLNQYIKTIQPAAKYRLKTKYTWTSKNRKWVKVNSKGIARRVKKKKTATIVVKTGKTVLGKVKVRFV